MDFKLEVARERQCFAVWARANFFNGAGVIERCEVDCWRKKGAGHQTKACDSGLKRSLTGAERSVQAREATWRIHFFRTESEFAGPWPRQTIGCGTEVGFP